MLLIGIKILNQILHWLSLGGGGGGDPLEPKKLNFLKHSPFNVKKNIISRQTIAKSIWLISNN